MNKIIIININHLLMHVISPVQFIIALQESYEIAYTTRRVKT